LRGIGIEVQVRSFEERSTQASAAAGDAQACAFIELRQSGCERFGVGLDGNIVTASIKALISGVNKAAIREELAATMAA
jgi:2-isopropylmalate synthase